MKRLCIKLLLLFRYHIQIQGVELTRLSQALYISNLTSQLDPLILGSLFKGRIVIAARLIVNGFLQFLAQFRGALFYSRAVIYGKSVMVGRMKKTLEPLRDQSIILFPQVHLGRAEVGESPIVKECLPGRQIVLVKISGMRGSLFSAEPAEKRAVDFFSLFKLVLKNCIFFMPKRVVTVELTLLEGQVPDMNRYLEEVYREVEPLTYVPYFFWKKEKSSEPLVDVSLLYQEIRRLSKKNQITPGQRLYEDLGLDSLDVTQLVVFIEKTFQQMPSFDHLLTVRDLVNAAEGNVLTVPYEKRSAAKLKKWQEKRPEVSFPKSQLLPEAFLERMEEEPSLPACVDPFDMMSYERMKTICSSLSLDFVLLKDEKIGVLLPSTGQTICLVLGLMVAKKVPVMMNWTLGPKHLQDVARIAELSTIITSYEFIETLPFKLSKELEEKFLFIEEMKEQLSFRKRLAAIRLGRRSRSHFKKRFGLSSLSENDPAIIFFTSGSEKDPKGVPLSHENLLVNEKEAFDRLGVNGSDVFFGLVPSFHVYGFSLTMLAPLMKGLRIVISPNPLDLSGALEMIQKWGVTILATTPTLLQAFLRIAPAEKLTSLRMIVVGAEKTPAALRKRVEALGIPLVEGYGTTECSPLLTLSDPKKSEGVGHPLPSVEIKILDPETLMPLPARSKGIIAVHGVTVFQGYLETQADPFLAFDQKKWYLTGDIGYLQEDGSLVLEGRISRTVKVGGELISLPLIESLLLSGLPDKTQIAVMALEKEEGRPELIVFTTSQIDLKEANLLLRQAGLSNLIRVDRVVVKESLPLIGIGKIDYRKLQNEL